MPMNPPGSHPSPRPKGMEEQDEGGEEAEDIEAAEKEDWVVMRTTTCDIGLATT